MSLLSRSLRILVLLAAMGSLSGGVLAQQPKATPNASATSAKAITVTGQHRGFTNSELYLKLDNDKEMTFLVQIANDKDEAWHKQFKTLSRIAVTYHEVPGTKFPVATAIAKAEDSAKR